jgi:poly(ADP-ribose) glycohydrolase ARH3
MARGALTIQEIFTGSALGTLVGDAFGGAVEGWEPDRIRKRYGVLTAPVAGRYTDDTEMMIGIMEALCEDPSFDPGICARRFLENYDPTRFYGGRIAGIMERIKRGDPVDRVGTDSFGNGAAMRVAPIGFFFFDDRSAQRRAAVASARITHTHADGIAGAVAQAAAVGIAARCAARGEAIDRDRYLDEIIGEVGEISGDFCEEIERIRDLRAEGVEAGIGALVENFTRDVTAPGAVPPAIAAFLFSRTFSDAVVIAVNAGGDADTVAAMAPTSGRAPSPGNGFSSWRADRRARVISRDVR